MKRIVLVKKTLVADGLTLAQATDAVAKANAKKIHELVFSIGPTDSSDQEEWALYSEPCESSKLFQVEPQDFIIDVPEADKIAIEDGKVAKVAKRR